MSEIRVDTFKAEDGIGAPSFPNGIQVTGIVTATVLDTTVPFLNAGSNVQLGNAGVVTATTFKGNIEGTTGTFTNVSVGGTLTYEDVTNVDSIGIVTARTGLKVTGGEATVGSNIKLGNAGIITASSYRGDGSQLTGIDASTLKNGSDVKAQATASGVTVTGTLAATAVTGNGSGLTNINASNISSGTIAAARVATLNQNTTGSAGSIDVSNATANSTYYPMFADNNGSAKSVYIDNGTGLTFNPHTNVLVAGQVKGLGTVELHGYNLNSAGDVGNGSMWVNWYMTPSIDWNKCLWGHTGCHRASSDTHYYGIYQFNNGSSGDISQINIGFGRAQSSTNHNQGWSASGVAMNSNGSFMSGNANTQCRFVCYSDSGGNSAPGNDAGHDHHAWVMFIHD